MAIAYAAIGIGYALARYAGQTPDGVFFRAVLTGAEDGLEDMALPISKLYARLYSGEPADHQVSVPYTTEIAAGIQARPNGTVRVFRKSNDSIGGNIGEALLFEFPMEGQDYYRGPYSATYVLSGSRQTTNWTPQTVEVPTLFDEGTDFNGGSTWTVPAWTPINPGDTALIGGVPHVIDRVQFTATNANAFMVLREAQP